MNITRQTYNDLELERQEIIETAALKDHANQDEELEQLEGFRRVMNFLGEKYRELDLPTIQHPADDVNARYWELEQERRDEAYEDAMTRCLWLDEAP